MAIILQVYQNKVKPLSIKLALLLLVSFFPSSLIAVTCTGGNILNGIQPNLGLVSALQNTSTSGAAIIDGRTLSIPTNTPCSGSDCFTIDATVTTLELKNFLTSLGYGQDRWRFNSAGPPGMDSGATFKSWQALKGYAEPFLIGYWDVGCGSDVSIISSTRPLNATTMII
ncbi:MAG TPA: hypothetical protein EYP39_09260, partial [Ghiorsea sp.]|nr:hypothetical protein [Ghiorsea sp.]